MLLVAGKGVGLEVNCEKTKYILMSREENSGQNRNINIADKCLTNGNFQTFGNSLINENCVCEEIKSRLNLENACCHSVQNILPFSLLSENLKNTISRNAVLPVLWGIKFGLSQWGKNIG
jgi:hypothetical protein